MSGFVPCDAIEGDPDCCLSCLHLQSCRRQACMRQGRWQNPNLWSCQERWVRFSDTRNAYLEVAHEDSCEFQPSTTVTTVTTVAGFGSRPEDWFVITGLSLFACCDLVLCVWYAILCMKWLRLRSHAHVHPEASSTNPNSPESSKIGTSTASASAPTAASVIQVGRNKLPTCMPEYWSYLPVPEQGWALHPVAGDELRTIRRMFVVRQPDELGKGRDAMTYDQTYSNLVVHCAWRIEHESLWPKYAAERNDVMRNMCQIRKNQLALDSWDSRLDDASQSMPGELFDEVGEKYLLHGTSPERLLDILHQGFTEKLSSLKGIFGAGNYLAEDPEKIDQYTRPDPGLGTPGLEELHSRLYRAGGNHHPDDDNIFYCFLVRATCGACLQTTGLDKKTSPG
ncbi:unnamed protein product [Durusdinium trenchii]|uniref:PARP catalytic domain-containing protein n=1 Tax=Durusdinium trenchii TaxID=1381693 RepID=A0ABP0MG95_9DINO